MAKERDEERQRAIDKGEGHTLGLMHGIPIAVDEGIFQKGKLATMGCAHLIEDFIGNDAPVLMRYVQAGAIPLVRGNMSQCGMDLTGSNHIYGTCKNPINFQRTCGGSSGGNAGLVASKCVPFAISSDKFLSISNSSAFCGIYSMKPTSSRYSTIEVSNSISKFS